MRFVDRCLAAAAALLLLGLTPGWAGAEVIDFVQVIDRLDQAGTQTEGNFQYRATVGEGWEIFSNLPGDGNPPPALSTFYNDEGSDVGDTLEIAAVGGGLFEFASVDARSGFGSSADIVALNGYLNGVLTQTGVLTSTTTTFQTAASGFTAPIDLLRVVVTQEGTTGSLILDNVVVTVVPEPASALTAAVAGLLVLLPRPRRAPFDRP